MEPFELVVVGAGPAGIATAVEALNAGVRRLVLLEKGPRPAFSIEKLYTPGKRVDRVWQGQDVPCEGATCVEDGTRESVLATLEGYVQRHTLPVEHEVEVASIRREVDHLVVEDTRGRAWRSRTVVVAIGVFGRPNRPGYPLPPALKERIRFDLTSRPPEGDRVLVVGGGNTALEYASFLHASNPTTLAYRGSSFTRANPANRRAVEELAARGALEVLLDTDIESVREAVDAPRVEVRFRDGRVARFDELVYAIGGSTPETFLRQAGVQFDGRRPQFDPDLRTGVPGLYLAGDLVAEGRGSIVKALNSGHRVVWSGLCSREFDCSGRAPSGTQPA